MTLETVGPALVSVLSAVFEFDTVLQTQEDDDVLVYTLVATIGFVGGLYGIKRGWDTYRKYSLVRNTATERVRSVAMGQTELEGVVRPAGDAPSKPFDNGECVYAYWRLAEYTPEENDDGETEYSWNTIAVGSYGTEFFLEGESGQQVLVDDTSDATVTLSDGARERTHVEGNEEPSERIAQFCTSRDISPTSRWRRRYTQDVIVPGQEVYVLGEAVPRDDPAGPTNADRVLLTRDSFTGEFIVSDKSQGHLRRHYRNWSILYAGSGVVVSVYLFWAWLTNASDAGYDGALTGAAIGLAILGVVYHQRDRVGRALDRFKNNLG